MPSTKKLPAPFMPCAVLPIVTTASRVSAPNATEWVPPADDEGDGVVVEAEHIRQVVAELEAADRSGHAKVTDAVMLMAADVAAYHAGPRRAGRPSVGFDPDFFAERLHQRPVLGRRIGAAAAACCSASGPAGTSGSVRSKRTLSSATVMVAMPSCRRCGRARVATTAQAAARGRFETGDAMRGRSGSRIIRAAGRPTPTQRSARRGLGGRRAGMFASKLAISWSRYCRCGSRQSSPRSCCPPAGRSG